MDTSRFHWDFPRKDEHKKKRPIANMTLSLADSQFLQSTRELTWIDLLVRRDAVGVDDDLERVRELVCSVERRQLCAGQSVD